MKASSKAPHFLLAGGTYLPLYESSAPPPPPPQALYMCTGYVDEKVDQSTLLGSGIW